MAVTFKKTKRGTTIHATGMDANALFHALAAPRPAKKPNPDAQVADWNNAVHVGQEVDFRDFPEDAPQRFKTRTHAEVLSGHTAVVWLEGKSGCVALEACTPVLAVEGGGRRCSMSKQSVVVFGPKGCGKTFHSQQIMKALGLKKIQDDFWFAPGKALPLQDTLVLTCEDVPDRFRHMAMPFGKAKALLKGGAS